MSLVRGLVRRNVRSLVSGLVDSQGGGGGEDPTISTIAAFEALSLTVAQFESNTETIAEFEAGLPRSEIEDQA